MMAPGDWWLVSESSSSNASTLKDRALVRETLTAKCATKNHKKITHESA